MRRFVVFVLLSALLAPAAAYGLEGGPRPDDGTLSVKRARGMVGLQINGAIIGRVARGSIRAYDPDDSDGSGPIVKGCDRGPGDISDSTSNPNDIKFACSGTDVRFRLIGGKYAIRVQGAGIYLSAVGHGMVFLDGSGDITDAPDGVFSLNGGPYRSLPDELTRLPLAAPPGP